MKNENTKTPFKSLSIRPFIGATDFEISRSFYRDLGWDEVELDPYLSVFKNGQLAFYLQKADVKDWIDNTMIFIEVDDVDACWQHLQDLDLSAKYDHVRLTPIKNYEWGRECFLHDPSGILWHFGQFKS